MDNLRLSVAPCRQVCPVDMNCQGYIRLIAQGREQEALEQVLSFGPLLEILAESCSAPCENACSRKKQDGAIHIRELKRYLAGKYANELNTLQVVKNASKKSIAIVGSDIATLASAMKGAQAGYVVTVFGNFDDSPFKTLIRSLKDGGVSFSNTPFGDIQQYDAVIFSRVEDEEIADIGMMTGKQVHHQIEGKIFSIDSGLMNKGVVYAIAEAFETMISVERFLADEPVNWGRGLYSQDGRVKQYKVDPRVGSDEPRGEAAPEGAIFDMETAQKQAGRCHGCGRAFEKNQTCWYCLPCEIECPQQALEVRVPYLVR